MNIVIFDGTFQTTAFIRRLMQGLQKNNQVSVLGLNEALKNKVEGVNYISLGSNQSKWKLIKTSIGHQGFKKETLKNIISGNRKKLQQKNLDLILDKINPDIIHIQWPSILPWVGVYLEDQKYPIILSQRGYHTNVRPFVKPKNLNYLKSVYPKLSGLHSVSKAISSEGNKIGIPKTRVDDVVYTGLALEDFSFNAKPKKNVDLQILSVGRPHWKKGYYYAIQAFKKLTGYNIDFHYTIVGGKESEELLYLINKFGLKKHVTLTSKLSQDDVFSLMKDSNLFLLSSLEEGIANVAVEAMALGTPVITTDCGGMKELIEDEREGFVIPTRNTEAIVNAITKFVNLNEAEKAVIVKNARNKVEKNFTEEKMVNDMLKLYKKVI